jgi:hypothetical protein
MIWNVSEWKVYTIDLKQEFLRVINHDQTISKKDNDLKCIRMKGLYNWFETRIFKSN